jgi:hypothetical protein
MRNYPNWRNWFGLAVMFLILVLALLAVYRHFFPRDYPGDTLLQERGLPSRMVELNALYPEVPQEENAAEAFMAVFKRMKELESTTYFAVGQIWKHIEEAKANNQPFSQELLDLHAKFLESHGEVLNAVYAIPSGKPCRYPVDFANGVETDMSHIDPAHLLATILRSETILASHRGDSEDAERALNAIFTLAESFASAPDCLSQTSRWRLVHGAEEAMVDAIEQCAFDDTQLSLFAGKFEHALDGVDMQIVIASAYAFMVDALDTRLRRAFSSRGKNQFNDSLQSFFSDTIRQASGNWTRENLEQALDDVRLSPEEYAQRYRVDLAFHHAERLGNSPFSGSSPRQPPDASSGAYRIPLNFDRMQIATRMVQCLIAVERYRIATGALPDTLSQVVPQFLETIPQDPFSGGPFQYRTTETGCLLYSVSEDFEDDGGNGDSLDYLRGEDWGFCVDYQCGS